MSIFKDSGFKDRQAHSADAKKALLEKFRAKPGADDPAVAARIAEREAIIRARQTRVAEKEAVRRAAEEKVAREKAEREEAERAAEAAREAKRAAEFAAREASRPRQIIRDVALYAERRASNTGRR